VGSWKSSSNLRRRWLEDPVSPPNPLEGWTVRSSRGMVYALRSQGHEVEIVGPRHVETEQFGADAGIVSLLKRWMPGPGYELAELAYSLATTAACRRQSGASDPKSSMSATTCISPRASGPGSVSGCRCSSRSTPRSSKSAAASTASRCRASRDGASATPGTVRTTSCP